jgi:hypothetical protein
MIVEGRISSLQDEIDIATDVERIASIHIADRRDEIQFLQYAIRIVQWVLVGADDNREQRQWIGVDKMLLEPEDIMRFENMLHEKIQELQVVESYSIRESDITMHEIETLEFVLDQLSKLKSEDCMQNKKEITEPTSIYGIQNIMK